MSKLPSQEVSRQALAEARKVADGLYPHQVTGVAFLLARRRAILADDMGLGKTRQSIVAMQCAEPNGPWLVVCPASVKRNWQREINLALGDGEEVTIVDRKTPVPTPDYAGWVVLNYDIIKKNLATLGKVEFTGFVFDEAHYLKNYKAQRTKAAALLLANAAAPVVHCLTGTPMLNRPRDLFPLLQLVNHPLGSSFLGYAKRYCDAHRGDFGWETKGASNLDELTVQLHGTMLRRTKDEVLDLPGKMRSWLTVDIPAATAKRGMQRVLATLLGDTSDQSEDGDAKKRLPPISRAKLLARLTPVRADIAGAKIKHTVEFAKNMIEQGEKVIIYTCFVEVGETIAESFKSEEVRFFSGSSSQEHRQKCVDDFQNQDDVKVLCATVIAGGVGITLTAARNVIFNDLDWVPANHWQAEDRAYRIGQTHPVNVYYFVASKSIDEFVGHVLETKTKIIGAVVDGASLGTEVASADVFTELETAVMRLQTTGANFDSKDGQLTLQQAIATYSQSEPTAAIEKKDPLHKPKNADTDAIRALARALTIPQKGSTRYRLASSKAGHDYVLELDGSDVMCTCRGFEFRGSCKHARTLKDALATGGKVPDEFILEED